MTAPAGPSFTPNTSRCPSSVVAIFCWRSCSVCTVRIASRSCAASSKRSPSAASSMRLFSVFTSSSFLPSRNSCVVLTARRVLVRRADRVDARRDAALDVVFEARPPALAGDHLVARPDAEQPVRQRHRLAREVRRQERTGVEAAVALDAPRDEHARERLVGRELQVGIVLVVAQQDVVFRRALLDEVVLERQRLDDRVGDDDLEAGDLVEQRVGLRVRAVRAEIVAHAVAQRARLADVDGVAARVEVQIDSRLLRQPGDLLLEFVDGHTVLCRVSCRCLNPPLYVISRTRTLPRVRIVAAMTFTGAIGAVCMFPLRAIINACVALRDSPEHADAHRRPHQRRRRRGRSASDASSWPASS